MILTPKQLAALDELIGPVSDCYWCGARYARALAENGRTLGPSRCPCGRERPAGPIREDDVLALLLEHAKASEAMREFEARTVMGVIDALREGPVVYGPPFVRDKWVLIRRVIELEQEVDRESARARRLANQLGRIQEIAARVLPEAEEAADVSWGEGQTGQELRGELSKLRIEIEGGS